MKMSQPWVLSLLLLLAALGSAQARVVNVSSQWCDNGCSEGHDDKECVCTFRSWMSPSNPAAWVSCEEVRCCDTAASYCDLGYVPVNFQDCPPDQIDVQPYGPYYCSVLTEQGYKTCSVPCGASGCFAYYNAPHFELVNEQEANLCTRSNETGDWWNPWSWVEDCTLEAQSPWDDSGTGLVCD